MVEACANTHGTTNWAKISLDNHTKVVYNEHLILLMIDPMAYDDYQEIILKAGELTTMTHKLRCDRWFHMSRSSLAPLYADCNKLRHTIKHAGHLSPEIQSTLWANFNHLNCHTCNSHVNCCGTSTSARRSMT